MTLAPAVRTADDGVGLAPLDEARAAIALAKERADVETLKAWDGEMAARIQYLKAKRDVSRETQDDAGEVKVRIEAALGALDVELAPHGVNQEFREDGTPEPPLADVEKNTRAAWRKLGALDEGQLDGLIAEARADEIGGVSTKAIIGQHEKERKAKRDALRAEKRETDRTAPDGTMILHHGDFAEHVTSLADGSVKLVLTDPPYGADFQSAWRAAEDRHRKISGDDDVAGATDLTVAAIEALLPKLTEDAHVLVFCRWQNEPELREALNGVGDLELRGSLVWDKKATGLGNLKGAFAPAHERILHFARPSATMRIRQGDVIAASRVVSEEHPTEKPVDLLKPLITSVTDVEELVVDPFAGTGSTLRAAKAAGRHGWGCEIDEHYASRAEERLHAAA